MNTDEDLKINRSVFAIAYVEAKAVVIVGRDDEHMLAFTPEAARLLGDELQNAADLAEGLPGAKQADFTATSIKPTNVKEATNVKPAAPPVVIPGSNGNGYVN